MSSQRPVPWPSDDEFCEIIARTHRPGDRHILLSLRLHDFTAANALGAYPGSRRIAALTGLSRGYVRTRLAHMAKCGTLAAVRRGRVTHYFIAPPPATHCNRDVTAPVTPGDDSSTSQQIPSLSSSEKTTTDPSVTHVSSPEMPENKKQRKNSYPADFETFWAAYPPRPGHSKRRALRAWKARISDGVSPEAMTAGATKYAASRAGKDPTFTMHASTFLGPDRRFEDEWEAASPNATPPPEFEGVWTNEGPMKGVYVGR